MVLTQWVLLFYGFTYNVNQFNVSLYLTMLIGALLDVVTSLLPIPFVMKRHSRRIPVLLSGQVLILFCSVISWCSPIGSDLSVWASMIGRGVCNLTGIVLSLLIIECFPSSLRATCYAIVLFVAKFICMFSPYYGALQHENP